MTPDEHLPVCAECGEVITDYAHDDGGEWFHSRCCPRCLQELGEDEHE